jgi:hypothetical protein
MPSRTRWYGASRVMSRPSNSTRPPRAGTSPIAVFSSVVLPTPLRPSSTVQAPAGTASDTSRRMWLPP